MNYISTVCRIQNLHISQTRVVGFNHHVRFVEFKIYISLKLLFVLFRVQIRLQNSKFTYLSNSEYVSKLNWFVCRIQNLHISQTGHESSQLCLRFVEFKIYISLKLIVQCNFLQFRLQNSKFTYLSNLKLRFGEEILNLGIKKWTDTDPGPKAIQIKSLFELDL